MDDWTLEEAQSGRDVTVFWDGAPVPAVRRVVLRCSRTGVPVRAFGEEEPDGFAPGCAAYEVEIERLRHPGDIRLGETEPSACVVRTTEETLVFSGCVWQERTERIEAGGHTVETLRFAAVRRGGEAKT